MTVHQAKGLEFEVVFLPNQIQKSRPPFLSYSDIVDQIIPVEFSQDEDDRKFFVAASRCKRLLYINYSRYLTNKRRERHPKDIINSILRSTETSSKVNNYKLSIKNLENEEELLSLSSSSINLFSACQLQYKFRYIDKFETLRRGNLLFGNNIHKLFELVCREMIDGKYYRDINLSYLQETSWIFSRIENPETNIKLKETGYKYIDNFFNNYEDIVNKNTIFTVEDSFNLVFDKFILQGRIDLVLHKEKKYELVEIKTGSKLDSYNNQLSFYSYAFNQKFNKTASKHSIFYISEKPTIEDIKFEDPLGFISSIENIVDHTNNHSFEPKPGLICKECSFNQICESAA